MRAKTFVGRTLVVFGAVLMLFGAAIVPGNSPLWADDDLGGLVGPVCVENTSPPTINAHCDEILPDCGTGVPDCLLWTNPVSGLVSCSCQ